ncbi:AfsR/SARP family transcriptional regulator [Sphaerisporangium fuscum]|uniref:AfsR/SARP family transcriptional regulator n=1 Tax=Sphaerisporangium fuscum TaxID=2835868 RepID=UPI001BDBCE72|nr:BTAD domain-containing putative transcriptional regulator [Sphaerisporangium fuscum]
MAATGSAPDGGPGFRVLGPLTVLADGREVPVAGNKLRVVLAGLLLRAGETVPMSRLATWLWDDGPQDAERARAAVHTYVNRLRRHSQVRDVVRTVHDGYRAEIGEHTLDLLRFRELAASAREAAARDDLEPASRLFSQAVELWRPPVLANVESVALHDEEVAPLTEEWLQVQEQWLDIGLRTGRHAELVGRLRELTRSHPLREPFWERLMLALYRGGRPAEALQAYHTVSEVLADELGVDPGPALRALHQAILTDDPSLGPPGVPVKARAEAPVQVPRQLRPDVPGFAGRRAQLAVLDGLLPATSSPEAPPAIVSVQGMAGSGKTALAVHWAHRASRHFPDGQLYLDLHGYGAGRPVQPAAALESLLRALGTPADRVPAGLDERAALFRTLLAGRRVLLLLDNAGGSEQVRPLVPGSGGMTIVTSRNQLRGLIVQYGARRVILDQMPHGEAVELLEGVLGRERLAAEPEAVADIIARCARLPLALRIFGERAARFPDAPLEKLACELRDERTRLSALDTGDGDETDVRMVFSWTYRALDAASARLFRLLGLHPGHEIGAEAAAALTGGEVGDAVRLLDRLTADHLLRSRSPGRYDFHDLLSSYAAERARAEETEQDADAALRRLLRWYERTAGNAARHLPHHGRALPREPAPADVVPLDFGGPEAAVDWYEEELPNLAAAVRYAASRGWHEAAWRLSRVLAPFFQYHVPGPVWVDVFRTAVRASRHGGQAVEEGWALTDLGCALSKLGRLDEAAARYAEALTVARRAGDRDLEGQALALLGTARFTLGDYEASTRCYNQALAIARDSGDRLLEAETLNHIARNDIVLGRHAEALTGGGAALAVYTELGDRYHQGDALRTLGAAHAATGRWDRAAEELTRALELMREFEDRRGEAEVLVLLGDALHASGDPEEARGYLRQALAILVELDDPGAADVRERLTRTGPRTSSDPRRA